jgi:hypothetical protein
MVQLTKIFNLNLKIRKIIIYACTVVEHSPSYAKVKASSLVTNAGTQTEKFS